MCRVSTQTCRMVQKMRWTGLRSSRRFQKPQNGRLISRINSVLPTASVDSTVPSMAWRPRQFGLPGFEGLQVILSTLVTRGLADHLKTHKEKRSLSRPQKQEFSRRRRCTKSLSRASRSATRATQLEPTTAPPHLMRDRYHKWLQPVSPDAWNSTSSPGRSRCSVFSRAGRPTGP